MYCKKCGKKLDYDGDLCEECRNRELVYGDEQKKAETSSTAYDPFDEPSTGTNRATGNGNAAYMPSGENGDRMHGFGKALTSAILGDVGVVLAYCGIYACIFSVGLGIFLILGSIALAVLGLVFGIQSVQTFIADKNAGRAKPIATLVCGIIGIVGSAVTAFVLVIMGAVLGIAIGNITPKV